MAATECPKCNYVRQPSDTAPDYECPSCGRVYAKMAQEQAYSPAIVYESGLETLQGQQGTSLRLIAAVVVVAIGLAGWIAFQSYQQRAAEVLAEQARQVEEAHQAAERSRKEAERRKLAEELERKAEDRRQRLAEVDATATLILGLANRWDDAVSLASRTARIALAPQIQSLQALRREAQSIGGPPCWARSKGYLVAMMDAQLAGFLSFLGKEPEQNQVAYWARAKQAEQSFLNAGRDCAEAMKQ